MKLSLTRVLELLNPYGMEYPYEAGVEYDSFCAGYKRALLDAIERVRAAEDPLEQGEDGGLGKCRYCGGKIRWIKLRGKWIPHESEEAGGEARAPHACPARGAKAEGAGPKAKS